MKLKIRKLQIKTNWTVIEFFIFLIIIMPIVDCINGYFQGSFLSVIGPVYRFLMLLIAVYALLKFGSKGSIIFSLFVSAFFLLHDFLFILFDNQNNNFSIIVERTMKYIYVIIFIETLRALLRKKITLFEIKTIFNYLSWLYPCLLIIPLLISSGGNSMYTDSGYKGFYYSGNAVSISMVVSLFVAMEFLYKNPCLKNLLRAGICLAIQLLIGAKTNYIFSALIIVFFALKAIDLSKLKNIKKLFLLAVIALISLLAIKFWFVDEIARIVSRQNYLYSALDNDWFRYLTSNRSIRIEEQLEQFKSNPFFVIFGMGYRMNLSNNFVEMDYFDLLFRYGAAITIVLVVYYLSFLKNFFSRINNINKDYFVIYIIMQMFAAFAGHIFCDVMAGSLFALVIAYISYNGKTNYRIDRSYV